MQAEKLEFEVFLELIWDRIFRKGKLYFRVVELKDSVISE